MYQGPIQTGKNRLPLIMGIIIGLAIWGKLASIQAAKGDSETKVAAAAAAQRFLPRLRSCDPSGRVILSARPDPADPTLMLVTVSNSWVYGPRQVRLQIAQNLAAGWSDELGRGFPAGSVWIFDRNGNQVGSATGSGHVTVD